MQTKCGNGNQLIGLNGAAEEPKNENDPFMLEKYGWIYLLGGAVLITYLLTD